MMNRRAVLIGLLAVAACEMPQPFRHTERNPLLTIGSRAGAVVRPSPGLPAGLPEAMAEALQLNDVAAAVGIGNAASFLVEGDLSRNGEWAMLTWSLRDPQGGVVTTHTQPLQADDLQQPEVMQRLAGAAAPLLAQAMVGPDEPRVEGPLVHLRPVQGAPADGNEALTRAMTENLRHRGFRLGGENADFLLLGSVLVNPGRPGLEHVQVVWTVKRPGNALAVGTIKQENDLPFGTSQLSWQGIAQDIASNASEGLAELIRRARGRPR